MQAVLSDTSKFILVRDPILKTIRQVEDKINRVVLKLKKLGMLSEEAYLSIHSSGSLPGILYGLPKIHKIGNPLRPIFAACGTPAYKLAKFLVPILTPITRNEYTIINSYHFAQELNSLTVPPNVYMTSFDVESLFTNIPLKETVDIAMHSLFHSVTHVLDMTSNYFRSLLELSVTNSFFIFNDKFYRQTDGVGMGLPLGPTFANIFMCHHESNWLDNCPLESKPIFYRRYVDDCFLLFRKKSHAGRFLEFLSQQHRNIKFTMEEEKENTLPFLDVLVRHHGNQLATSVYRKPTFTGLGTSFFSFIPIAIKASIVKAAVIRAFRLVSSYESFHQELCFLISFFQTKRVSSAAF